MLVTGASGQVGSCLVDRLKKREDVELCALSHHELDIADEKSISLTIESILPDVIINAAAYTAVDKAESEKDKAYSINADACKYLAKAAAKNHILLMHISTDYVFDGEKNTPYTEQDTPNPMTVYGKSKLAGEQEIQSYGERYVILRTAWVFGLTGNNFVKTMLRLAKDRKQLRVVSDQFGAPTFADDIAATLILIMDKICSGNERYGVYHYSGYPYTNWADFAENIFTATDNQEVTVAKINSEEYPTVAKRPKNSKLDCSLIHENFGINPSDWKYALTLFRK